MPRRQRCPFVNPRSSTDGVWAGDESRVHLETAWKGFQQGRIWSRGHRKGDGAKIEGPIGPCYHSRLVNKTTSREVDRCANRGVAALIVNNS